MNMDNKIHCQGLEMRDKKDWNGKYPYYEPTRAGFIVHLSKKATLQGVFTNRELGEQAYKKYRGKIVEADERMKANKKGK